VSGPAAGARRPPGAGGGVRAAIGVTPRSAFAVCAASLVGLVAFGWPFVVIPGRLATTLAPPVMFGVLLVLVLAVVFAELADGGIDAKAIAMLGVLSAFGAALRPLGAGTAGLETVFFVLVLAGRVFGPGFGFALGCTTLFSSALITGGVGPWLPYQMFGAAWVGMGAGLLPHCRGRGEVLMLAAYGAVSGYFFGFMLNLSFWPFVADRTSSIAYLPGASFAEQWHRYLLYDATTSLGWDTGRAVTNFVAVLLVGQAALVTFRRAARRASFQAPVAFAPPTAEGLAGRGDQQGEDSRGRGPGQQQPASLGLGELAGQGQADAVAGGAGVRRPVLVAPAAGHAPLEDVQGPRRQPVALVPDVDRDRSAGVAGVDPDRARTVPKGVVDQNVQHLADDGR
jgi:energy-coupling factor transport system substrate-specific component